MVGDCGNLAELLAGAIDYGEMNARFTAPIVREWA